ncbi:hypothetical protein HRbin01_00903 [archaeon HR01]|nr:hypothetical protein HRbin01_00903 [archaeon HR01]
MEAKAERVVMSTPGRWSEEQKFEVIRSSIGNSLINIRLLLSSPLAAELGLVTPEEREILSKAAVIIQGIYKRAREKGIIR